MKRRLSLALVVLLAIGGVTVPAVAAEAAGTTKGTVKVQLLTPKGKDFLSKGFYISAAGVKHKNVTDSAKTNAHGVATFKIAPGTYKFTVQTYKSKYQYAVVTSTTIGISRGQVKTIGVKMYLGAVVTGKVMTPTGFALKGATVAAVNAKGVIVGSTTTDSKGKYKLRGLPTGKYAILFNERSYVDGKNKAAAKYGWRFYKGTSLAAAKKLTVYQQNRFTGATKTTGISGPVAKAGTLSVTLTDKNSSTGRLLVDHLSAAGAYLQSGSVYAPFKNGTSASLKVIPGKYRLGVVYAGVSYYYMGDYQTLTTDPTKAWITYMNQYPLTVAFGPIP